MIDAEELARWEKAARKDNPSYWGSDTLVKVFDELRRVEAEHRKCCTKLALYEAKVERLQDELNKQNETTNH